MRRIDLNLERIEDKAVLDVLVQLRDLLEADVSTNFDGLFFEFDFDGAVTNYKYPHNLGFKPLDVIQTSTIGAGVLTWNYDEFDETELDITTTGACIVRAFIGSYLEE